MHFARNEGGAISYKGRDVLRRHELEEFLKGAFRKKLRKRGQVEQMLHSLRIHEETEFTWNFVPRIRKKEDHWVTVHAWLDDNRDVRAYVIGPQADDVIEKVNRLEYRKLPSGVKTKIKCDRRHTKRVMLEKKRRRREGRLQRWAQEIRAKPKTRRSYVPAPISLERNERLTPQFRKNHIFWKEALTAIVAIFEVKGNGKKSGRELAAQELWASLERSGYRFAQYKRRGFTIRVDLVDGIWRGEITPLKISCTKDNSHPTYRRMRAYLGNVLVGLPEKVQAIRRYRIAHALQLAA